MFKQNLFRRGSTKLFNDTPQFAPFLFRQHFEERHVGFGNQPDCLGPQKSSLLGQMDMDGSPVSGIAPPLDKLGSFETINDPR